MGALDSSRKVRRPGGQHPIPFHANGRFFRFSGEGKSEILSFLSNSLALPSGSIVSFLTFHAGVPQPKDKGRAPFPAACPPLLCFRSRPTELSFTKTLVVESHL